MKEQISHSHAEPSNIEGTSPLLSERYIDFLRKLEDPRRDAVLHFYEQNRNEIESSLGSKTKHQAWEGGYVDHLAQCFRMAESMYEALSAQHPLPFSFASTIIVLNFHDIEKIWKYTTGLPDGFNKNELLFKGLKEEYGIEFSEDETNALHYIHGEPESEYNPDTRIMSPLASFCHAIDTMSARMWFDQGQGLG